MLIKLWEWEIGTPLYSLLFLLTDGVINMRYVNKNKVAISWELSRVYQVASRGAGCLCLCVSTYIHKAALEIIDLVLANLQV